MISSLAGDIIGSAFESKNMKQNDCVSLFSDKSRFTDDTILTIATADAILRERPYAELYLEYAYRYPQRGYGSMFQEAVTKGKLEPYNSFGNGSAMRVGPVAWAFNDLSVILEEAKKSSECTHNHPDGIKGAQAVAHAIWLGRNHEPLEGCNKGEIRDTISQSYGYDLSKNYTQFEKKFDVTCQGTIPRCMAIFMGACHFEQAMRISIEMGGDVDTNCCIVGSICDAYYGLPSQGIIQAVYERLPIEMSDVVTRFVKKYIKKDFDPPLFVDLPSYNNSILSLEI